MNSTKNPKTERGFVGKKIIVNDNMQSGYAYLLSCAEGKNFAEKFTPYLSPIKMLEYGVFEGKYMNDCRDEFPEKWFTRAKLSNTPNPQVNYFQIKSRQNLSHWQEKKWIIEPDVRGWFQWYCRYYYGRRLEKVDARQIARWSSFCRHVGQIKNNCTPKDLSCRPRQRQALLQWAYNPFI